MPKTEIPPTADELKQRLLAGDHSITPEALALAQAREEHARIVDESQRRAEAASAEAARRDQVAALRQEAEGLADDRAELLRLATAAVEALTVVYKAATERGDRLDDFARQARALGVASMGLDDALADDSGLGWRRDRAASSARLRVGDLLLTAADPIRLVSRVVVDATNRVGKVASALVLATPGPDLAEQIDAQVRAITAPAMVQVRVVRRWGAHQPGAVVAVDSESARWAVQRHFAEPVA